MQACMQTCGRINRAASSTNNLLLVVKLTEMKNWYKRTIKWARTERALAMIAFAESSFFPIPPDPILLNMSLDKPHTWKRYAAITIAASVLGGIFGYIIGIALFESFGDWIISTYHLEHRYEQLGTAFTENGLLTILAAALTPIPYKIFTITAGAFQLNFVTFIVASIIGRGARFTAVSYAASKFGKKYRDQIGKYIDLISVGIIGLAVLAIIVYSLIS